MTSAARAWIPSARFPAALALCGLLCGLVSLVLPAIELTLFDVPTDVPGAQTAAGALGLGLEALRPASGAAFGERAEYLVDGLAALSNLAFLVVPALLLRGSRPAALRGRGHRALAAATALALLCALGVPFVQSAMHVSVETGYEVWLAGHGLLLVAVALAAGAGGINAPRSRSATRPDAGSRSASCP